MRIKSLDLLRGLAIFAMIFSGRVPWNGVLPGWMYHAQLPPPTNKFNPNFPGITWVDLVFPFFLFAAGCAIPLALSKKLKNNINNYKIILDILNRTFLLIFFSIFLQHTKPYVIASNNPSFDNIIALISLVLMFLIFGNFKNLSRLNNVVLKLIGFVISFTILFNIKYPDNSGFKFGRNDIIILVIAINFLFTSIIWLITKEKPLFRIAILAFFIALRISSAVNDSWISQLWKCDLLKPIFFFEYLKYLIIMIPATIIGDLFLNLSESVKFASVYNENKIQNSVENKEWDDKKYLFIAIISFSYIIINIVGLYNRYIFGTTLLNIIISAFLIYLVRKPIDLYEKFVQNSLLIGIFFILIGLFVEPLQGGIKKDPATYSYLLLTTGLAIQTLISLSILVDYFQKDKYFKILINIGKNPLMAYTGHSHILWPILFLSGLDNVLNTFMVGPLLGTLKAFLLTLILAYFVNNLTEKKYYWKT
ncbi:MAG TPA: DUF5009 domain-containing protein [Ignavibacteriales bacterium]|nr:DUF5009 domain-containing protein [Ignavibacteriales bacterium]